MMDVHSTYCGHHFMMYVSQIIMLYILMLYSAVYLNKTGSMYIFITFICNI